MYRETWYRAVCFGRPVGPWHDTKARAQRDLIEAKLGSFDDYGTFYVTVPGDLIRETRWIRRSAVA